MSKKPKSFEPDFPGLYWCSYIKYVAEHLHLNGWSIGLDNEPCSNEFLATCEPLFGRNHAIIQFCSEWSAQEPEVQREAVIHELLHIVLNPLDAFFQNTEPLVKRRVFAALANQQLQTLEYTVDALSQIIAPFIDVPSIPVGQEDVEVETPNV